MKIIKKITALLLCVLLLVPAGSVYADGPSMSATCTDEAAAAYHLSVDNYTVPSGAHLRTAVWCKNDQSDLIWYDMNGTALDFSAAEIGSTGKYIAHCYAIHGDGTAAFVSGIEFNVASLPKTAKTISGDYTDSSKSVYKVTVTDPGISGASSVRAGVWTESGGQDDLFWLDFSKSGSTAAADINVSQLKHTGKAYVHVYGFSSSGQPSFINGLTFDIETAAAPQNTAGTLTADRNISAGSAVIKAEGIKSTASITKVSVAVWSKADQSDIKWYDMTASGSSWQTTMNIANHNFNRANYYAHCYATAGGTQFFAGGCMIDLTEAKTAEPKITAAVSSGNYTVTVSDTFSASDITNMKVAVWSEQAGQDDLNWYDMSASGTTWTVSKAVSTLKHSGKCFAHVYYTAKDGSFKFLTGVAFDVEAQKVKLYAQGNTSGKRTLVLENAQVSVARFAVWSDMYGQDDLIWYTGVKNSSGAFTVDFDVNSHKNAGTFYVHVYSGNTFVEGAVFEIASSECQTEYTALAASMKAASQTDQLILVGATGTDCTVAMLNKNADGTWFQIFSTPGQVGQNGIGEVTEWNRKTPVGVYNITEGFGINAAPSCQIKYTQVDSTYYWVDDVDSPYYNKFVTTKTTSKNWNSAEHIIDYTTSYQYCLAMDFNKECVPGAGSAIFLHVGHDSPTLGCIGIPLMYMENAISSVRSGCKIVIDTPAGLSNY